MFSQDPQPQVHSEEWILSQEEYGQLDIDSKMSQYYKHSRNQAPTQAKKQETERKEARSKSANHQRNLQGTLDRNSSSPPPVRAPVEK